MLYPDKNVEGEFRVYSATFGDCIIELTALAAYGQLQFLPTVIDLHRVGIARSRIRLFVVDSLDRLLQALVRARDLLRLGNFVNSNHLFYDEQRDVVR